MRSLLSLAAPVLAVVFAATACGKSTPSPPTTPTAIPNPTFRATLNGGNEVPAITNAEKDGTGTMNMTLVVTRDAAGAITAATVDFNGTFAGFPTGTVLTAAHIHTGVGGVNGGFVVNTAIAAGEVTMPGGTGTLVKNAVTTSIDVANQIIANPAAFYFNAHTAMNPGGVVRGQLVRTN